MASSTARPAKPAAQGISRSPKNSSSRGAHDRTKDSKGHPIKHTGAPEAVRVIHKPCTRKKGAKITTSLPHRRQKATTDHMRIVGNAINSAGFRDIQRGVAPDNSDKILGISRIYARIACLEQVFLAYERDMLRRWREKVEASGKTVDHRLMPRRPVAPRQPGIRLGQAQHSAQRLDHRRRNERLCLPLQCGLRPAGLARRRVLPKLWGPGRAVHKPDLGPRECSAQPSASVLMAAAHRATP
ncbi:hypothetical protein SAMN04488020_1221 [Palleronia marisminoris]|uniref:Uncharacterized protein n=1 Tax=Palleronia marisminoris TaxID=315423 RepID=A0A1Y5TZE7_9RHOB|nr:hypothetical protein SAMN04488020_1221 [Palleronia marisminoris]SLN72059.1 hypothetical protein PAM7066_03714 [Palleronia marisminoris]